MDSIEKEIRKKLSDTQERVKAMYRKAYIDMMCFGKGEINLEALNGFTRETDKTKAQG